MSFASIKAKARPAPPDPDGGLATPPRFEYNRGDATSRRGRARRGKGAGEAAGREPRLARRRRTRGRRATRAPRRPALQSGPRSRRCVRARGPGRIELPPRGHARRSPPAQAAAESADRAKKRFARDEYGERQLLLRALAVVPTRSILAVLEAESRTGAAAAAAESRRSSTRGWRRESASRPPSWRSSTSACSARHQLLEGATRRRGPPRSRDGPVAAAVGRHHVLPELGRLIDVDDHRQATLVGSRGQRSTLSLRAVAAQPRSVCSSASKASARRPWSSRRSDGWSSRGSHSRPRPPR